MGAGGVRYIYYLENDQKQLVESTHTEVRAERSFTLLEDVNCPAVLAEQCFVTNEADVAQFGSEEGCKKISPRLLRSNLCILWHTAAGRAACRVHFKLKSISIASPREKKR